GAEGEGEGAEGEGEGAEGEGEGAEGEGEGAEGEGEGAEGEGEGAEGEGEGAEGEGEGAEGEGEGVADDVNLGWIGGACRTDEDCPFAGGRCLTEQLGFPGGLCTTPCERLCPDHPEEDYSMTFCVADQDGEGTCISRCDPDLLPGTGCRPGYGCAAVPRQSQPDFLAQACVPLAGDGRPRPLNSLQPALEAAAARLGLGAERITLIDLTVPDRPETAQINGLSPIYPASVIKLVVMVGVEREVEEGRLTLQTLLTPTEQQTTCTGQPEGDLRPQIRTGVPRTVGELEELMITRSDNSATNVLIDAVGRDRLRAYMEALGLPGLQLYRYVFGCEPYDDPLWDGVHLNSMTALETAQLLALILDGGPGFLGEAARLRMQEILGDQLYRDGIYQGLPDDALYLSKTGTTSTKKHDAGLILWQEQRYALAAFLDMTPGAGTPLLEELGEAIALIMEGR
ncbi:MAG: serine hydrolase, partial [Myxococcota bacterium]|nr:serine hydrolase [Myxococcota bacterium]